MNRKFVSILAVAISAGIILGVLVMAGITPMLLWPPASQYEKLELVSYHFNSSTNVTLSLKNNVSFAWSLIEYSVRNNNGNQYTRTSWTEPSVSSNSLGTAIITIGSSCSECSYQGTPGAFSAFSSGQKYTMTVLTSRNNQFSFPVMA